MRGRSPVTWVAVAIVAVNLIALVLAALDRSQVVDGPAGSSFVTTALGTAALAETLEALGVDVTRLEAPLTAGGLEGLGTYVAVEPETGYGTAEIDELRRFAEAGGTLVLAGRPDEDLVAGVAGTGLDWVAGGIASHQVWLPPAWPGAGSDLTGDGIGAWEGDGGLATLGGDGRVTGRVVGVGAGLVHLVADAGLLANQHLDTAGNARWAVDLLGRGPVAFDEFRHGRGAEAASTGSLVPPAVRRSLPALAVAGLLALVAYGRRLAPISPPGVEPAPGRIEHVESLAGALARTRRPGAAVEPSRRAALDLLSRRQGIPRDSGPQEVREAARRAGLSDGEATVLARGAEGRDEALEVDRALAALRKDEGGGAGAGPS